MNTLTHPVHEAPIDFGDTMNGLFLEWISKTPADKMFEWGAIAMEPSDSKAIHVKKLFSEMTDAEKKWRFRMGVYRVIGQAISTGQL
jgi:hypothetical protein